MKMLLLALGIPIALLAMAIKTVLRQEYAWWAPTLARWMVRVAARFQGANRERYAQEWLAELDQVRADFGVGGLMWASSILAAAPVTRWSARQRGRLRVGIRRSMVGWLVVIVASGIGMGLLTSALAPAWFATVLAFVAMPLALVRIVWRLLRGKLFQTDAS